MRVFLLLITLLFFHLPTHADEADESSGTATAISELAAEKESLATVAGCVNVVSGDFFYVENDLHINNDLQLSRIYDSGTFRKSPFGFRFGTNHATTLDRLKKGEFDYKVRMEVREGCALPFCSEKERKIDQKLKIEFRLDTKKLKRRLSNVSPEGISALNNPINTKLVFETPRWSDRKTKGSWTVYSCDGGEKHYVPCKEGRHYAFLTQEKLPNGNYRFYNYQYDKLSEGLRLINIHTKNSTQEKVIGSIDLDYSDGSCVAEGSNTQKVSYAFSKRKRKRTNANREEGQTFNLKYLDRVSGDHLTPSSYQFSNDDRRGRYGKVREIHKPGSHRIEVEYASGSGHVHYLNAPLGANGEMMRMYSFGYDVKNHETKVKDAYGFLTKYKWKDHRKITDKIDYDAKEERYRKKKYFWDERTGWLIAKELTDGEDNIRSAYEIKYDQRGNILREAFIGNLTGAGDATFKQGVKSNIDFYTKHYEYDERNLLTAESDDFGCRTEYTYKPGTNLVTSVITVEDGVFTGRIFYTYDDAANVIEIAEDDGPKRTIHKVTEIIPSENLSSFGKPEEVIESYFEGCVKRQLKRAVSSYNASGLLECQTVYDGDDTLRYLQTYTYDVHDRLIMETDPEGIATRYGYDDNNNKVYETREGTGREFFYTYDAANRLVKIEERHQDGQAFFTHHRYDLRGLKVATIDCYGNTTRYVYDAFKCLVKEISPEVIDEKGNSVRSEKRFGYDRDDNVTVAIDEEGNKTATSYTAHGKPFSIRYADGSSEAYRYLVNGWLQSKVDRAGTRIEYSYDRRGHVIKEEVFDATGSLIQTTAKKYKGELLVEEVDAMGIVTRIAYDGAARKCRVEQGGRTTTFHYDPLGRMWKTCEHGEYDVEKVFVKEYDNLDRVIEERIEDRTGLVFSRKQCEYDADGNIIRTLSHISQEEIAISQTKYDPARRPVCKIDPLGNTTHITYDQSHVNAIGQDVLRKVTTDPMGLQTIEIHDAHGRVVSVEKRDTIGATLSESCIFYDKKGQSVREEHTRLADGEELGHYVITRSYNPMGQIAELNEQKGKKLSKVTRYHYTGAGLLKTLVKPDGVLIEHTYDPFGNILSKTSSDGTISYVYSYDAHHNPVEVVDTLTGAATERHYNTFNEITLETLANSMTLRFGYDPLGRVSSFLLPDGSGIEYAYNALGLTGVSRTGEKNYTHTYADQDLQGKVLRNHLVNGEELSCGWDLLGRRISTTATHWEQTLDRFDAVGNLLQATLIDSLGEESQQYTYDDLYQLKQEKGTFSHEYTHDSIHNRLSKDEASYAINGLNQITSDSDQAYVYDVNGNLIRAGDLSYSYDALNRLIQVEAEGVEIAYQYDAFGRRLVKCWSDQSGITTERYLYHAERDIGTIDANGKMVHLRVLGRGKGAEVGAAIAIELEGKVYAPIHDARGNICCLLDSEGAVAKTYRYSAFGEYSASSGLDNPWLFSSKRIDQDTGLFYFGKRDYNPVIGRWTTPDPQGFEEGPNLYAYVFNRPMTLYDPYGLFSLGDLGGQAFGKLTNVASITGFCMKNYARHFMPPSTARFALEITGSLLQGKLPVPSLPWTVDPVSGTVAGQALAGGSIRYVSGVGTTVDQCVQEATKLSGLAEAQVNWTCHPCRGLLTDLAYAGAEKLGIGNSMIFHLGGKLAEDYAELVARGVEDPHIYLILHSRGALEGGLAAIDCPQEVRNALRISTIGGAKMISSTCFADAVNYVNQADIVPRIDIAGYYFTSPDIQIEYQSSEGFGLPGISKHLLDEYDWAKEDIVTNIRKAEGQPL